MFADAPFQTAGRSPKWSFTALHRVVFTSTY